MSAAIRSAPFPQCPLCGTHGEPLYTGLHDRLFSAPGTWSHRRCPQRACGLVWLDPMPGRDDIQLAYRGYYTGIEAPARKGMLAGLLADAKHGYLANRFGYVEGASAWACLLGLLAMAYPGRTSELDFSVMWLEPGARGRLLDIGAGSGWLVEHMNTLGWRAEGLDFDASAVQRARARGLVMHEGGLAEQHFPDAAFDAVTMSHSLEHVHDPVAWLAEARRVLKPGGRLSIATPNTSSLLHRRHGACWFALDPPRHLHLFNRGSLSSALDRAGFERRRIFTSVRDANGAWLGGRAIRRTGRHDMLAKPPLPARAGGRLFQLWESLRLALDSDAGEDLVAIARK